MGDKKDRKKFTGYSKHESVWDKNRKRLYKGRLLDITVKDVPSDNICKARITQSVGLYNTGQKSNTVKRGVHDLNDEQNARSRQDLNNLLRLATERQQDHVLSRQSPDSIFETPNNNGIGVSNWVIHEGFRHNISSRSIIDNEDFKINEVNYNRFKTYLNGNIHKIFPDDDRDFVEKKQNHLRKINQNSRKHSDSKVLFTENDLRADGTFSLPRRALANETPISKQDERLFSGGRCISSQITPKNEDLVFMSEPNTFVPPKMSFPIFHSTTADQSMPKAERPLESSPFILPTGNSKRTMDCSNPKLPYFSPIDSPMPHFFFEVAKR